MADAIGALGGVFVLLWLVQIVIGLLMFVVFVSWLRLLSRLGSLLAGLVANQKFMWVFIHVDEVIYHFT